MISCTDAVGSSGNNLLVFIVREGKEGEIMFSICHYSTAQ